MAGGTKIIGADELARALEEMLERLDDLELITKPLAEGMRRVVHIQTGYLQSTIYHNRSIAGADAPYAGFEADRGDILAAGKRGHDYAQRSIDDFDADAYFDRIVEPF